MLIFAACVFTVCGESTSDDGGGKGPGTTTEEPETPGTPAAPERASVTPDQTTLGRDPNGTTTGAITAEVADAGYSYTWTGSEWSSNDGADL